MPSIDVIEVGPRDGLQNEAVSLTVDQRLEMISGLVAAGAQRIEVASFVNPVRVPQMAGSAELISRLPASDSISYIGVILNARGVTDALDTAIDELNFVVPCTDAFAHANQNSTVEKLIGEIAELAPRIRESGKRLTVTLAVAFGCPYSGDVPVERVAEIAARVSTEVAPDELAIADTIGSGTPWQVREVFTAVGAVTDIPLRAHFHETRHTGIANIAAAMDAGVRSIDASTGGLGGCPFAPGAAGNVATEDIVWALERSGFDTGIDVNALIPVSTATCSLLGVSTRSGIVSAGAFPASALAAR
jgi:hydroxymethylglutaryl-CoA lyase